MEKNERIKQLAEQTGHTPLPGFDFANELQEVFLTKFALLIVKECAAAADDWYQNHEQLHWDPATHILAHFGVE